MDHASLRLRILARRHALWLAGVGRALRGAGGADRGSRRRGRHVARRRIRRRVALGLLRRLRRRFRTALLETLRHDPSGEFVLSALGDLEHHRGLRRVALVIHGDVAGDALVVLGLRERVPDGRTREILGALHRIEEHACGVVRLRRKRVGHLAAVLLLELADELLDARAGIVHGVVVGEIAAFERHSADLVQLLAVPAVATQQRDRQPYLARLATAGTARSCTRSAEWRSKAAISPTTTPWTIPAHASRSSSASSRRSTAARCPTLLRRRRTTPQACSSMR